MRKKSKTAVLIFACVVLALLTGYAFIGNPLVFRNNQRLQTAVTSLESETILLNEVVPFDWDTLYTFTPYESKAEIEKTIGFHSPSVKENNINDGMVHLLFVNDDKVVASILGYEDQLGYSIDFSAKGEETIAFAENARFRVAKTAAGTALTYQEETL